MTETGPTHGRLMRGDAALAVIGGIAVALLTVAFRMLASVDLPNDHFMTLGWAQQVLFGAWPERDFVDPGMPLAYLPSALVQSRWPGPFSEMLLTSSMLGIAAAATWVAAARLSRSWLVALGAVLLEVILFPRLYAFPKVLAPAVALWLFQRYATAPTRGRLVALGAWTTTAALLRHDLGAYVAIACGIGLLLLHLPDIRRTTRAGLEYVLAIGISVLPYAVYVQWAVGWPEHLRRGVEFTRSETHQLFTDLPRLGEALGGGRDGSVAALFFLAHAVAFLALVRLIASRRSLTREARAGGAVAIGLLVLFLPVILRKPIDARLPDLAGVMPLALAWLLGEGLAAARRTRVVVAAPLIVLLVGVSAYAGRAAWVLGHIDEQIDNTGVYAGARGLRETWEDVRARGSEWPWARAWPTREQPAVIRYLRACTLQTDFALLTWPAPEYYFFARRPFGAGHVEFLPPSAFATETDQRQMLAWMREQRIPVLLTNADRHEEFARTYPRVAAALTARYRDVGSFTIYDGSRIVISARSDLRALGTWGDEQWPCGFE